MKFANKKLIFLFLSFLVILTLAGAWFLGTNNRLASQKVSPKVGQIVESIYGLGTVTPDHIFHLRTAVSLSVTDIYVREGDFVEVQKPLIKLDDTVWKSPIRGTVTSIFSKKGELVSPLSTVLTVIDLSQLFLEVSLEQQSIMRVKKDQSVIVSFESLRNEKFKGHVSSIYPRENQFIVRIELEQWPAGILPGMTADVAILIDQREQALLIPIRSIFSGQVIRFRDGKKQKVAVKLGVVDGEWAEVLSENILPSDFVLLRR